MSQFVKETIGNVFRIKCPVHLDAQAAKDFADQSKAWMMSSATHFALDFLDVRDTSREFYRAVFQFKNTLKPDGKTVCSVNASAALLDEFRSAGVESIFGLLADDGAALHAGKHISLGVDAELVKIFLRATKTAFEAHCQTPVQATSPFLKVDDIPGAEIVAFMPLLSNVWVGALSLCLPEKVFLKIYENIFSEKQTRFTPDHEESAGEFFNLIYGVAKPELRQKGYVFQSIPPKVLFGEALKASLKRDVKTAMVLPYETEAGRFHVQVEFEN